MAFEWIVLYTQAWTNARIIFLGLHNLTSFSLLLRKQATAWYRMAKAGQGKTLEDLPKKLEDYRRWGIIWKLNFKVKKTKSD